MSSVVSKGSGPRSAYSGTETRLSRQVELAHLLLINVAQLLTAGEGDHDVGFCQPLVGRGGELQAACQFGIDGQEQSRIAGFE